MGTKAKLIHEALHHKGVVITEGIPEHIIEHMRAHGYKIKRLRKRDKKVKAYVPPLKLVHKDNDR